MSPREEAAAAVRKAQEILIEVQPDWSTATLRARAREVLEWGRDLPKESWQANMAQAAALLLLAIEKMIMEAS